MFSSYTNAVNTNLAGCVIKVIFIIYFSFKCILVSYMFLFVTYILMLSYTIIGCSNFSVCCFNNVVFVVIN